MFRIFFSTHGEQAFAVLPKEIQIRAVEELTNLAKDPFWYNRVKKLRGSKDRYRLRLNRWRVLFTVKNNEIEVADIFFKKERGDYRRRNI